MDEVGALYERNGEDEVCFIRASYGAELGLFSSLSCFRQREGSMRTPFLSQRRARKMSLVCKTIRMQRGFPSRGMQTIFGRYREAQASGGYTVSLYLEKQSQTKAA